MVEVRFGGLRVLADVVPFEIQKNIYGGLISSCAGIGCIKAFWVGLHFQLCEELEMRRV